jgi:TPR repeat protein
LTTTSTSNDVATTSNPGSGRSQTLRDVASRPSISSELAGSSPRAQSAATAPEHADDQMRAVWRSKFRRLDRMFAEGQLDPNSERPVDPSQLAASAAKGDPSAALALHRVVAGCLGNGGQASSPDCRNLPQEVRADPLHWVLLAGQLGDPRAALPIYGLARDSIGTSQDPQRRDQLRIAALDVLDKSVAAGSADALALMWNVYSDGRLAQPDPVKAFAYLDGYAQATGDTVAAEKALGLWQLLRQADRTAAQALQTSLLEGVRPP